MKKTNNLKKLRESFFSLKPVSWGKKAGKLSEQVDEVLYGKLE